MDADIICIHGLPPMALQKLLEPIMPYLKSLSLVSWAIERYEKVSVEDERHMERET